MDLDKFDNTHWTIGGIFAVFIVVGMLYTGIVEPLYEGWYENHIKRTLTKYHHRQTKCIVFKEKKAEQCLNWDTLENELLDK